MPFRLSRVSFCPTAADAMASPSPQMPHMHGHVLVVENNAVQPEVTALMLRRWDVACQRHLACWMQ